MARFNCEVFGYVQYTSDLSYAELIEREEALKEGITEALHTCGAEHLDVFGLDDGLRIQFVLEDYSENRLHEICDAVAPLFSTQTPARFFAVQKLLEVAHLFEFTDEGWKEAAVDIKNTMCA